MNVPVIVETSAGRSKPVNFEAVTSAFPTPYPYFEQLRAHPARAVSYGFRSQAELDSIPTGARNPGKLPTLYDPAWDGAAFRVDPSGMTPGSGSTDTQQKRVLLPSHLGSSLFFTWDCQLPASLRFVDDANAVATYKAYRWDYNTGKGNGPWLAQKFQFFKHAGKGLAEVIWTMQSGIWVTGGTSRFGETLKPQESQFYIQADTLTRFWVFIDGPFGSSGVPIHLSVWAADATRPPVQIYNRIALLTPDVGLSQFLFEFDTSDETATFGLSHLYHRNFAMLKGLTREDVDALLVQP